ncbi:MAG: hypothetical protein HY905_27755 [Deltaproteobacteria bacterium]|nr:hypothetical protein [Deltaproteobacteria bacterium]
MTKRASFAIMLGCLGTMSCAPGGDDGTATDARPDAAGEIPDSDADAGSGEDAAPPDGAEGDAAAEVEDTTAAEDAAAEDAAPAEPVCRYECGADDDCVAVYGVGWVCRDATFAAPRLCLTLCATDDDCRVGAASDPLMICRSGACAMRACTDASECGWVGARADCRGVDWGTMRSCQRTCMTDGDCGYGVPSDALYHCEAGLCAWYCDTDDECFTAFGSRAYGCREPSGVAGATCIRDCATDADCLLGGPSDVLAVCR